jgi:hypothetical protein
VKSRDLIFRANTFEGHEALNLKSNDKNKYNIILSIGEDKVTKDAAAALLGKHPDTSIIATLDEQGKGLYCLLFVDRSTFVVFVYRCKIPRFCCQYR